jgi:hypothetical protein
MFLKINVLILLFLVPGFSLFPQSDTIPYDSVISKRIENKNTLTTKYFNKNDSTKPLTAYVIYYSSKCSSKISYIKSIKYGFETETKHFIYFGNCNIKEIFSTNENNNYKEGPYTSFYPNSLKRIEGQYKDGKKDSLFIIYDIYGNPEICKYYHRNFRISKAKVDNYYDSLKIKNIITIDIPTLIISGFKLSYERILNKKNTVFIELEFKPGYQTDRAEDGFITFSHKKAHIYFLPERKQIAIGYKHLFGGNHRKPFYWSSEIFYLNKYYNKVYCLFLEADGAGSIYLQSSDKKKYGVRFTIGKKYLIGKSKCRFNEIFDFYIGGGIYNLFFNNTVFGEGHYSELPASPMVTLYKEPKIYSHNEIGFSVYFGLRFGLGFK